MSENPFDAVLRVSETKRLEHDQTHGRFWDHYLKQRKEELDAFLAGKYNNNGERLEPGWHPAIEQISRKL